MSKQKSTIQVVGKLGNMRGFKRPGTKGILASSPGGGSKSHFLTSEKMQRTRENANEQGMVFSASAAIILLIILNALKRVSGKSRNLLTKIFRTLTNTDTVNPRGNRSLLFSDPDGILMKLMEGINISKRNLNSVIRKVWTHSYVSGTGAYSVTFAAGLAIGDFFAIPKNAKYFRITLIATLCGDRIYDATANKYLKAEEDVNYMASTAWIAIATGLPAATAITVTVPTSFPVDAGLIGDLQLQFAEEINGNDYSFVGDLADVVITAGAPA
jgi:hypothetical protein